MKRIVFIALKDLRQNLRERSTFLFLLIMPVVFTLLFGVAFGGLWAGKPDLRPVVGLVDQDGSPLSQALVGWLSASTEIRLEIIPAGDARLKDPAGLDRLAGQGKMAAALVIPAGWGQAAASGTSLKLEWIADPTRLEALKAGAAVRAAAWRIQSAAALARQQSPAGSAAVGEALTSALVAWQHPPVSLVESARPHNAEDTAALKMSQTAPGMMLQFAFAGLLTAAQVLVNERKSRCLPRLITTSVARVEILLGHYLALFILIFAQLALLIAFGQILLKLDYLRLPIGTLAVAAAAAACVAALGLLIGALARSDDQAIIFAMIPMMLFAALGGAWVPLETTGAAFQAVGRLSPVAWAMDGFKTILTTGLGPGALALPVAALLGFALLFGGLAVWKFRTE
jgi:ABC-2 type transport system permease protein